MVFVHGVCGGDVLCVGRSALGERAVKSSSMSGLEPGAARHAVQALLQQASSHLTGQPTSQESMPVHVRAVSLLLLLYIGLLYKFIIYRAVRLSKCRPGQRPKRRPGRRNQSARGLHQPAWLCMS